MTEVSDFEVMTEEECEVMTEVKWLWSDDRN